MEKTLATELKGMEKKIKALTDKKELRWDKGKLVAKGLGKNSLSGASVDSEITIATVLSYVEKGIANGLHCIAILDALRKHKHSREVLLNNPTLLTQLNKLEQDYVAGITEAIVYQSREYFSQVTLLGLTDKEDIPWKNCTDHYNQIGDFFLKDVVEEANLDIRTLKYNRWLMVASSLEKKGDFLSVAGLVGRIDSSAMLRMQATQAGIVNSELKKSIAQQKELIDFRNDFSNLSKATEKAFEKGTPIVPYSGLFQGLFTRIYDVINETRNSISTAEQAFKLLEIKLNLVTIMQIPKESIDYQTIDALDNRFKLTITQMREDLKWYEKCQTLIKDYSSHKQSVGMKLAQREQSLLEQTAKMAHINDSLIRSQSELTAINKELQELTNSIHKPYVIEFKKNFDKTTKKMEHSISSFSREMQKITNTINQFNNSQQRLKQHENFLEPVFTEYVTQQLAEQTADNFDDIIYKVSLEFEPRNQKIAPSLILTQLDNLPIKKDAAPILQQRYYDFINDKAIDNETQFLQNLLSEPNSLPTYVTAEGLLKIVNKAEQFLQNIVSNEAAMMLLAKEEGSIEEALHNLYIVLDQKNHGGIKEEQREILDERLQLAKAAQQSIAEPPVTGPEQRATTSDKDLASASKTKPEPAEPIKQDTIAIFAHGTWQGERLINRKGDAKPRMRYRNIISQFAEHCRTPHLVLEGPDILGLDVFKNLQQAEQFIIQQAEANPELKRISFAGFSRGAAMGKRLANRFNSAEFKEKYKEIAARNLSFDIFAIDPVAGFTNKADRDAIDIPPNVKNYVATYQLDEPRLAMKPQGTSRTHVIDPSQTSVTFLPLPGVHTAGTVVFKEQSTAQSNKLTAQQPTPCLTWHLLHDFMAKKGVRFKNDRVPALSGYDKKARQSSPLSVNERFIMDKYRYTEDLEENGGIDRKLLKLYANLKLNRNNNQTVQKILRSRHDHRDDFVLNAEFFINQHERELFKRSFPKVFNYFFEMHQPELSQGPIPYSLDEIKQELQQNLEHPIIKQLVKQYVKDKSSLNAQSLHLSFEGKTCFFLPGGHYRIEPGKFFKQQPVGDTSLAYLEHKTLSTLMKCYRSSSNFIKNKRRQQVIELQTAVRAIMKENRSDESKAFKIDNLLQQKIIQLNSQFLPDKTLINAIRQIRSDETINLYITNSKELPNHHIDALQDILVQLEQVNKAAANTLTNLDTPFLQGAMGTSLNSLSHIEHTIAQKINVKSPLAQLVNLQWKLEQELNQTAALLKQYKDAQLRLPADKMQDLDNPVKLAAIAERHNVAQQHYEQQKQQLLALTKQIASLHPVGNEQKSDLYPQLTNLFARLQPKHNLLFANNKFIVKRTPLFNKRRVGLENRDAFNYLLTFVDNQSKQGYFSWSLLDQAATSAWGKRVLSHYPEVVGNYQQCNQVLVARIADAINHDTKELFLKITEQELLQPGQYQHPEQCPNIVAFTENFNQLVLHVQNSILTEANIDIRTLTLERWLGVMDSCLDKGNFHAARAIHAAVNSGELHRLQATKAGLSPVAQRQLVKMDGLFNVADNSNELRQAMLQRDKTTIPFLGILTKDIAFAASNKKGQQDWMQTPPVLKTLEHLATLRGRAQQWVTVPTDLTESLTTVLRLQNDSKAMAQARYQRSLFLEARGAAKNPSQFISNNIASYSKSQFENRAIKHLLHKNLLIMSKPINTEEIKRFNIPYTYDPHELSKLGVQGLAKHETEIKRAQEERNAIRKIKNKALEKLLISGHGPTLLNITPEQISQLNQCNDALLSPILAKLQLKVSAEQLASVHQENAHLRTVNLFDATIFTSLFNKYPKWKLPTVNGQPTAIVQHVIADINTLMVAKEFKQPQLAQLFDALGLGSAWLDTPARIGIDQTDDTTWWESFQRENVRLRQAQRFAHPILQQSFLNGKNFSLADTADLSSLHAFSSNISRGKINECLSKLVEGWTINEEDYKQIIAFNQQMERLASHGLGQEFSAHTLQLRTNIAAIANFAEPIKRAEQHVKQKLSAPLISLTIKELLDNMTDIQTQKHLLLQQQKAVTTIWQSLDTKFSAKERAAVTRILQADIPFADIDNYAHNKPLQVILLNRHIQEQLAAVEGYEQTSSNLLQYFTLSEDNFIKQLSIFVQEQQQLLQAINVNATEIAEQKLAGEQLRTKLDAKLWQLPSDSIDAIQQQFPGLSAQEIDLLVAMRQQIMQMHREIEQILQTIDKQQQQTIAETYKAAAVSLQFNTGEQPNIAKPATKFAFDKPLSDIPAAGKLYNGDSAQAWLKQEKINKEYIRHTHHNGLSIMDSKKGLSFYERPDKDTISSEALQQKEKELCSAWVDLLMPQIVNSTVTIGGYDQNLRQIMAKEFTKRGVNVIFENKHDNVNITPEGPSIAKDSSFGFMNK